MGGHKRLDASGQRKAGVILGYVNILVKNLVNLAYTPMLLSFVGQGDYGVFEMANSAVYSLTLLTFGLSGSYVRFYTRRNELGDERGVRILNGVYLLLYSAIGLAALVLGLLFAANAGFFFSGGLTVAEVRLARSLMTVMSVNIAVTLFSNVFNGFITAHERFTFQQSRQMLTTLTTPFLALALLWLGAGVVGVACAQLAVNLVLLALNALYSLRTLGMRFELREREKGLVRSLAVFSSWLFLNQVMDWVEVNVPSVILGALCGSSTVAVFAIAGKIRTIFISLSTTMSSVFTPLVNRIVVRTNDDGELTRIMARVGRYQLLLLSYVYGGFAFLGPWFVSVWAGPEYADAYLLVMVMVLPLLVPLCQSVGIEIQRAKNMHRARSLVYLAAALANLVVTVLLADSFGYWAAAIGYAVTVVVAKGVWMNWYYQKRVGMDMPYFWRQMLPVLGCAFLSAAVCYAGAAFLVPVTGIASFLAWGVVYTALLCALAWKWILNASEKESVLRKVHGLGRG